MFAFDPNQFQNPLHRIHKLCRELELTIATAESCTGGLLSGLLTHLSGSSAYFLGGFCTYSNEAKTQLLGVPAAVIAENGAVSETVAKLMAEGARKALKSDLAIAITGIAGPTGGSPEKPVGTVYCAWSTSQQTDVQRLRLQGDREQIRSQTCLIALEGLGTRILSLQKEVP